MGHVVNPISWRLSHIKIWKNSFTLYDINNYSSLNTITSNIIKTLEVLCRRRIIRGNLFFFGGLKYLTSSSKSLLLFSFKSRFYYIFALSSSLFNTIKKKMLPVYLQNIYYSDEKFLNLVYLKKRFYFTSRFYYNFFSKIAANYLRFYWPKKKYHNIGGPIQMYKDLFRFVYYSKFVSLRRFFSLEFYIFFKTSKVFKHTDNLEIASELDLINLYLQYTIKRKKKTNFKRNLGKKSLNLRFNKTNCYSAIYIIRKFFPYRWVRKKVFSTRNPYIKDRLETTAAIASWTKFILKYRLWRLFFELPIIFKFKLFFIKFLMRYFGLDYKFVLFFFLGRGISYVDASLMRDFLLIKIKQKFKVAQLYKASAGYLIKLLRLGIIRGFKVFLAGRFSRKDRATFIWHKLGRLPLSDAVARIDYAAGAAAVRYSTCATKVWIYF